jgi:hypothetical protein
MQRHDCRLAERLLQDGDTSQDSFSEAMDVSKGTPLFSVPRRKDL